MKVERSKRKRLHVRMVESSWQNWSWRV